MKVTPEQAAVIAWLEGPGPTPSADEVAHRFREAGLRSNEHVRQVQEQVKSPLIMRS